MFEIKSWDGLMGISIEEFDAKIEKKIDEHEKKLYTTFDWDPESFRKSVLETHVNEALELKCSEYVEESEKYEDEKLYEMSEETGSLEGPNCYAFALQLPLNPLTGASFEIRPMPGSFSHGFDSDFYDKTCDILDYGTPDEQKKFFTKMMKDDAKELGMQIKEVSRNYQPQDGEWLMALATTDNLLENPFMSTDFHFYRKGKDGNWYHKPGMSPVEYTNRRGDTITDPGTCNRGKYKNFLGYYAVSKI